MSPSRHAGRGHVAHSQTILYPPFAILAAGFRKPMSTDVNLCQAISTTPGGGLFRFNALTFNSLAAPEPLAKAGQHAFGASQCQLSPPALPCFYAQNRIHNQ